MQQKNIVLIIRTSWKIVLAQWLVKVEHYQIFNILQYCEVLFLAFFAFQSMKGFYEDLAVTVLGSNLVGGSMEYRVGEIG